MRPLTTGGAGDAPRFRWNDGHGERSNKPGRADRGGWAVRGSRAPSSQPGPSPLATHAGASGCHRLRTGQARGQSHSPPARCLHRQREHGGASAPSRSHSDARTRTCAAGRRSSRGSHAPECRAGRHSRCGDDVLEPDAALRHELRVLRAVRVEALHRDSRVAQCVLRRDTSASAPVCQPVCPNWVRDPSIGSQRQPSRQ
jgi:hypothetical protein